MAFVRTKSAQRVASPVVLAIFCCVPLAYVSLTTLFGRRPLADFMTYWSAARLFDLHGNPYSVTDTLALERTLGWPGSSALVMLCPPWTLSVVAPGGLFSFRTAQALWLGISLALDAISAVALWRYYGGALKNSWIALAVALTLTPLAAAEFLGQITPLMLAGLSAFLLLLRKELWFWAGVAALGLLLKPQLLWLVLLAVFLWTVQERKWQVLVGGFVAAALATAAALIYDPASVHYFHNAYGAAMATDCGFGGWLRSLFGHDRRWLQYVPCLFGAGWFAWYWMQHRRHWDWPEHLPLLLLVSVVSSPYCWLHDFIMILPAWIALAARGAYRSLPVMAGWLVVQEILLGPESYLAAIALSVLWIPLWLFARAEAQRITWRGESADAAGAGV
jgi:hypothetical protein